MIALRSALFNALFYLNTILLMIFGLPALIAGRHAIFKLVVLWSKSSLWLLRVICGTRCEFRGLENIPKGPLIVAPKHQSAWETFALEPFFTDYSIILKRQLLFIPLFGWFLRRAELIAIDRASGRSALEQITEQLRPLKAQGRQLFVFPEGTRRPAFAPPRYKYGVAQIYAASGLPCLPVAHNAGLFWPRRSFLRKPGTIVAEFLPAIPPGLPRDEFFQRLQNEIEAATNRLMAEAVAKDASLGPRGTRRG